ncbi:MAG: hypothetical protein QOE06_1477 [Thermoleophilaceae bacterium]|jgi:hypothetical protein|nr:hypothetical protein [Thermoleophilaceae bacterium]
MLTRVQTSLLVAIVAALCLLPGSAFAQSTGGAQYQPPASKAKVVNGKAIAPSDAPQEVKDVIAALNRIITKPYRYGGGHAKVEDTGYDCSGSVSYGLIGGGLLKGTMDSSGFMGWGAPGKGKWITTYANGGHAWMVVAGLRLDTGYRDKYSKKWGAAPGTGPRWGGPRSTSGFTARHPAGF